MDKMTRYRQLIQQVLESYALAMSRGNQVQLLPVCDMARDQYLLVSLGWSNKRREHAIVFHAQLQDGEILLEDDRTETGLSDELIQAGVSAEDIRPMWVPASRQADQPFTRAA